MKKNKNLILFIIAFILIIAAISLYSKDFIVESDIVFPTEENLNKLEVPKCPDNGQIISKKNFAKIILTPQKEDTHQIVCHNGFTLCYREKHEQAEWVCYTLNNSKLQKNVKRDDNFRQDPKIITKTADFYDYKGSGYDKGHLAPCGDLTYSFESMNDSFYFSNMSPQNRQFNQGIWNNLEKQVRKFAKKFDELYIVTGPILDQDSFYTIGKNQVSIPEYYYKAILGKKGNEYSAIGFIIPNENCEDTFWNYVVSIDQIEEKTKLDFFHLLDDTIERQLESKIDYSNWIRAK